MSACLVFVTDFDGTITKEDTTPVLAQLKISSSLNSEQLAKEWKKLSQEYYAEWTTIFERQVKILKENAHFSIEDLRKFYEDFATLEKHSIQTIQSTSLCELFTGTLNVHHDDNKGMTREWIREQARTSPHIELLDFNHMNTNDDQKGENCLRVLEKLQEMSVPTYILSGNWYRISKVFMLKGVWISLRELFVEIKSFLFEYQKIRLQVELQLSAMIWISIQILECPPD